MAGAWCHELPVGRLQRIYYGWLCAPLVVSAVTTLLYLWVLLLSPFLLFNHTPFTAFIRSAFLFIPAEFAFLGSALARFLEFLSVSLLGWELEKFTQAHKKQKRDKWLFIHSKFSPLFFFLVSPTNDLLIYYEVDVVTSLFIAVWRRNYCVFDNKLVCSF